jgi:hypothetical protein
MLFSSAGLLSYLTAHYQKICPPEPDEHAGAIYSLDERGKFVYLTLAQHRKVVGSQAFFIAWWFCAGVVEVRNGWLRRAKRRNIQAHPE